MKQHISKSVNRTILLNPGPATTSAAVKAALVADDICPREHSFGDLMLRLCDGLLAIGDGAETHEAALFAASGTGAMEAVLTSAIAKDDRVLILTNGAYGFRMRDICNTFGISHETLGRYGEFPDLEKVEEVLQSGQFSHLAFIHHETSTGMLNQLEDITAIAHRSGVAVIVDMMSSFGAYPFSLSQTQADFVISSSNKCIHGMAGLSYVLFHKKHLPALEKNSRGYYFDVFKQWKNLHAQHQLRFTPPVQICYAFDEAITETLKETVAERWKRYTGNWQILYDGLKQLGFRFLLPDAQQSRILLAVDLSSLPGFSFDDFHDALQHDGITVYPGVIPETRTFRVAVIGDLYPDDMHRVVASIEAYVHKRTFS
jgi:2-aminoethylphosphonate aminotransferase